MKKITLISLLLMIVLCNAQFNVKIESPKDFSENEAYLYSLSGSKDVLMTKSLKQNGFWIFKVPGSYWGMMKAYFPNSNASVVFISENKDVDLSFSVEKNKVSSIDYKDSSNKIFYDVQDQQKKKEQILPALYQIQTYYKSSSPFGEALGNEIANLDSEINFSSEEHSFIEYYNKNYNKYISNSNENVKVTNDEVIHFLNSTNNFLETSSLLKPLLMVLLSNTSKSNIDQEVDKLLKTVDIETPRGQIILSELIDIFNIYNIKDLKNKYLSKAQSLKCTINERLKNTIKSNENTLIGQKIPNNIFIKPTNTKAKSIYDVKADKKIVVFWASTCPHCEKEITEMLSKYSILKSKNIEIIGLSLDTDSTSYFDKVKMLPWINDTELKGWYSDYVDIYNVHATPTFYVLDANNRIIASPENFNEVLNFLGLK